MYASRAESGVGRSRLVGSAAGLAAVVVELTRASAALAQAAALWLVSPDPVITVASPILVIPASAFAATYGNSAFETARANFSALAGMTNIGDATVITGSGETNQRAAAWAKAALARVNSPTTAANPAAAPPNLLRPTPDTARLAYMMLASLGGCHARAECSELVVG